MKKQLVLWLVLVVSGATAQAQAQIIEPFSAQVPTGSANCVIPKVDGERVPFPLRAANTKFELAQDETYLINGTLTKIANKVYLHVDFASQPWLATEKMMQFPYFAVDSLTESDMSYYTGKLVQVAVVARKVDAMTSGEENRSALKLSLILPPVSL